MIEIIDASVAIKWFIKEKGHETSLAVLERILESPEYFAVPELFYFEVSHVLNRLIPSLNRGQKELLHHLLQWGVVRFSMTKEWMEEIRRFQQLGLSGYDSAYAALAKILKGTWLSFDKKAHAKIAHLKLSRCLS